MSFQKRSNFFICILFISTSVNCQNLWPFQNPNGEVRKGNITGTVGEFRSSGGVRFHAGVDFTSPLNGEPGKAVFSMHTGTAYANYTGNCWGDYIRIHLTDGRDVYYKHIRASDINPVTSSAATLITNATPVQIGTFLGKMTTDNPGGDPCWQHVHVNDNSDGTTSSGSTNFINNFVHPFSDNVAPDFITPFNANGAIVGENSIDAAEFWRNGKTYANASTQLNKVTNINGVDQTIVYSKVDIISRIRDRGINDTGGSNGGNNGINSVNLQIINSSNVAVGQEISNINFNTVPPNDRAQFLFDSRSILGTGNTESRHVYILTSSVIGNPPYDRFWNTGLREGQTEDWVLNNRGDKDARSIDEALYKDGKYTVRITARDINNNTGDQFNPTVRNTPVVVDNFLPYVKHIEIRKDNSLGRLIYVADWKWDAATGLLVLVASQKDDAPPLSTIWIKIQASEPMEYLQLRLPSDLPPFLNETPSNSSNTEFIRTYASVSGTGEQVINIEGADLAGNSLLTVPAQIPLRQANGSWPAVLQGTDTNHKFNIGWNVCSSGTLTNGRISTTTSSAAACLYADFSTSKSSVGVSEQVIFTPVVSGTGLITYKWNFGSDAIPATSTSPGPQTVIYSSGGAKTVSLQVCDATTNCITEQKTNFVNVVSNADSELSIDFSAAQTAANTSQTIQLTSTVTGAVGNVSYLWGFDDGVSQGIFTDPNPLIAYYDYSPGTKTISLTVTADNGSVTKTKTGYLTVIYPYFNVVPSIGGCATADDDGKITFSRSVSGGNGEPYNSYLWDFGDGETSTSSAGLISHVYKKSGKFTVRLTVCDKTGCGTAEQVNCVTVLSFVDSNTLNANFVINNLLFGSNTNCIASYPPLQVSLNTPVIFTNATTGGGDPSTFNYSWNFDSHICDGGFSNNTSVPSTASVKGPVEVYYTTSGYKEVSLTVVNERTSRRESKTNVINVTKGLGKGTCYATLGTASISTNCWSPSNLPKVSIPVLKSNCPVAKIEVTYWTNGVGSTGYVLPNGVLDFNAMGIPMPTLPLTADFSFTAYQYDGINYNSIGYKRQRFTIYGPVLADAGPDRQVCMGNSTSLGSSSDQNSYSYSWTSSNPSALNFLSASDVANPIMVGVQKGLYTYSVTVTDQQNGCKSRADNVVVTVDRPEVTQQNFPTTNGSPTTLNLISTGGFGNNTFLWSPATNLSSPIIINPVFTSSQDGAYSYSVTVTDKIGCSSTGQIIVDVSSSPANLVATAAAYSRVNLTWIDRTASETGFLIRRSIDGVNFTDFSIVGPNTTYFDDINVSPGITYYYLVAAQLMGDITKDSNLASVNTQVLARFTEKNSNNFFDGTAFDFDNDNDLDFAFRGNLYKNESGNYSTTPLQLNASNYIAADFDNDNDLDLYAPTDGIILRNDNRNFISISTGITNTTNDYWNLPFDYNRDNFTDIISAKKNFTIQKNIGNSQFSEIDTGIPNLISNVGGIYRTFSVGDLNNDGYEDLITGSRNSDLGFSIFYKNTGRFYASDSMTINSSCCSFGVLELGDFDNNSKLDVFGDGWGRGKPFLLKNQGELTFSNTGNKFISWYFSRGGFGDFDMDGDLDLFVSTPENYLDYSYGTRIYQNNNGIFNQYFGSYYYGSRWIDYDSDGDLDIVTMDKKVLINNLGTNKYSSNSRPQPPTQVCSYLDGEDLVLSWNRGSDAETSSLGLTYNLYVLADEQIIMSPLSDLNTGFRKIVKKGNVDQNTLWRIYVGDPSSVSWGVQSIDNSFIGSAFSHAVLNPINNICGNLSSTTYRGTDLVSGYTCPTTTIGSGITVNFEATKQTKLGPGFRVLPNGSFYGKIVPITNPCTSLGDPGSRIGIITETEGHEAESANIELFPNPTNGKFTIRCDLKKTCEVMEINVYSVSGQSITTRSYTFVDSVYDEYDLTLQPSGVYVVKVSFNSYVKYLRVVKF